MKTVIFSQYAFYCRKIHQKFCFFSKVEMDFFCNVSPYDDDDDVFCIDALCIA